MKGTHQTFADETDILTPEGVAIKMTPASFVVRACARLMDGCLKIGILIGYLLVAINTPHLDAVMGPYTFYLLVFLLTFLYDAVFEYLWRGRTPGKAFYRLKVVGAQGHPVTFGQALARNLMRYIDALPSGYLAGLVAMSFSPKFQRLGDLLADTMVVHDPGNIMRVKVSGWRNLAPTKPPVELSTSERMVFAAFAERYSHLAPDARRTIELKIAGMFPEERIGNPGRFALGVAKHYMGEGRLKDRRKLVEAMSRVDDGEEEDS